MRQTITMIIINILILAKPSYRFSKSHRQNETLIYRVVNTVQVNQTLALFERYIKDKNELMAIYN